MLSSEANMLIYTTHPEKRSVDTSAREGRVGIGDRVEGKGGGGGSIVHTITRALSRLYGRRFAQSITLQSITLMLLCLLSLRLAPTMAAGTMSVMGEVQALNQVMRTSTWLYSLGAFSGSPTTLSQPLQKSQHIRPAITCQVEPVRWVFPTGVTPSGNSIKKTGGIDGFWDAGATSSQIYESGDAWVEATAESEVTLRAFGLSHDNPDAGLSGIDFAIVPSKDGVIRIYENGWLQGSFGPYQVGDRLRVASEAGQVTYYLNGSPLYHSQQRPEYPLFVDASINTMGALVFDVNVCGVPPAPPTPISTSTSIPTISTSIPSQTPTTSTTSTTPGTSTPPPTVDTCDRQPVVLIADDGGADGMPLGYLDPGGSAEHAALWLNRFPVAGSFHLERVSIAWPSPQQARGLLVGRTLRILVYYDPQGHGTPVGATLLYEMELPLTVADGVTFQDFYVSVELPYTPGSGGGDLYVGYEDVWAEGGYAPAMYPSLVDRTTSIHRSWVVGNGTSLPDRANIGVNRDVIPLDSADPGNWLIRASGWTCAPGTPGTPGTPYTPRPTQTRPPAPTPLPGCNPHFSDVGNEDWFYTYVRDLYCTGVVSGYSDGTFRPYNGTTRGQLAKILVRAFNLPAHVEEGPHFTDVPQDNPFYDYVETVLYFGIVGGYPDGTFRPGAGVTRGQLAKMVTLTARQADPAGWPLQYPTTARFADVPYGTLFYPYVETAAQHGIVAGYPCGDEGEPCPGAYFRPQTGATRAQIAKIVRLAADYP